MLALGAAVFYKLVDIVLLLTGVSSGVIFGG